MTFPTFWRYVTPFMPLMASRRCRVLLQSHPMYDPLQDPAAWDALEVMGR
jgi:hypothetical protein